MVVGTGPSRAGACYVVVDHPAAVESGRARIRMRMTDDLESGPTAEVQLTGVDDACATLRAWLEGLLAARSRPNEDPCPGGGGRGEMS